MLKSTKKAGEKSALKVKHANHPLSISRNAHKSCEGEEIFFKNGIKSLCYFDEVLVIELMALFRYSLIDWRIKCE